MLVFVERLTAHSAFTIVGATFELYLRNGVARCQGTFRHAILLGSVAAAFLSLYIGLWLGGTRRAAALLGGVLCLSLVVLSNSGGPLTSAAAVFLGWSIWPLRNRMSFVRSAMVVVLLLLLVFMKAPIWYLPFKISALVGGGGYQRAPSWSAHGRTWTSGGWSEWMLKDRVVVQSYSKCPGRGRDEPVIASIREGSPLMLCIGVLHSLSDRSMAGMLQNLAIEKERLVLLWPLGGAFVHAVPGLASRISTSRMLSGSCNWQRFPQQRRQQRSARLNIPQ